MVSIGGLVGWMNENRKGFIFLLAVLLVISLIFNFNYYRTTQERKDYYWTYIHDFYHGLRDSISILDSLIKRNNPAFLEQRIFLLTVELGQLHFMANRVPYYFDGMGGYSYFEGASRIMSHGYDYKGNHIPPFLENHKLDQQEIAFLNLLRNNLVEIYEQLPSEETGQLSKNITKKRFQDIINEHVSGIGKEAELMEAYMKAE